MKRVLVFLVISGMAYAGYGQRTFRFNVHADPQFAWFNSDEEGVKPNGSIFHIQTGLQMDLFFQENYAFALGIGINNLGGNLFYSDSAAFYTASDTISTLPMLNIKHNLQYVDIPLGLKLKTEELGYMTFFLQVGLNPMINISAKASAGDESFTREEISESARLFNLGYHAGAGVEYRLGGSTSVIGGIRWSSGLTDVTGSDLAKVTTRALSIHLGILF